MGATGVMSPFVGKNYAILLDSPGMFAKARKFYLGVYASFRDHNELNYWLFLYPNDN